MALEVYGRVGLEIFGVPIARSATFVVAASNASLNARLTADYVCDGTADEEQIQAAIDAVEAL